MKKSRKYAAAGGEEIIIAGKKQGRLVVKEDRLFFEKDGVIYSILAKDVLYLKIAGEWFGIASCKGMEFRLDARIYEPKKAKDVA